MPAEKMLSRVTKTSAQSRSLNPTQTASPARVSPSLPPREGQQREQMSGMTRINTLEMKNPSSKGSFSAFLAADPAPSSGRGFRLTISTFHRGRPSRCSNEEFLGKISETEGFFNHPHTVKINQSWKSKIINAIILPLTLQKKKKKFKSTCF